MLGSYAEYTAKEYRTDFFGIKHMLRKDPGFDGYAPTRSLRTLCKATEQRMAALKRCPREIIIISLIRQVHAP